MKYKLSVYTAIFLLMLFCNICYAQGNNASVDSLIKHAEYYHAKKSDALIFAHLDKTVYINNDVIWFTAYLLGVSAKDLPHHDVLSVALVNNNDQKVVAQDKFVMDRGLGYGNLTIPDSVAPGHYSFIAYTNRLMAGKPEAYFNQPITIKTATDAAFNVELTLDTLYKDPENVRVLLNARTKNTPLNDANISYYLGKNLKTRLAGKAKTNVIGSYTMLIPKNRLSAAEHNLEVLVKSGTETKTLHLDIPVKKNIPIVQFYPEGGHIVAGLFNKIGWEVKTAAGSPIKTLGVLYIDNKALDTIATDSYGMGAFYIDAVTKANYTVKLLDNVSDIYALPSTLIKGVVVTVNNALVNDTLKLQIKSTSSSKYHLVVHNYKHLFLSTLVKTGVEGALVKVALAGIPRGINAVTVLDSLQRPCAERLFFAHYNQKPKITIGIDTAEPGKRQKVNLKLKLNAMGDKPASGVVSVACVQDNRFEIKNDNNIEHYVYLQNELDNLPVKERLIGTELMDYQYLNELLLVRGWRKYTWSELIQSTPADTIKNYTSPQFTGVVTDIFMYAIKKPMGMALIKDSLGVSTFPTDAKGAFVLSNEQVHTPANKKVKLVATGKSSDYLIKVIDPYKEVNNNLAKTLEPVVFESAVTSTTQEYNLKGFEHATHLKEVKITSANNNNERYGFTANACGDYVCIYHILNCRNHVNEPTNRAPHKGEMVSIGGRGLMRYAGCADEDLKPGMMAFAGIYSAEDYYGANYAYSNPTEPDYLSTICWKHGIAINSDKETTISFYTSDITGKFRIVVQGVTNEDVVYGEDSFVVKKKTP